MAIAEVILETQPTALQGYWKCDDEDAAVQLADASGNANHLTLVGELGVDYSFDTSDYDNNRMVSWLGVGGYAFRNDSVIGSDPTEWTIFAKVKGTPGQDAKAVFGVTNSGATAQQVTMVTTESTEAVRGFCRNDANVIQYLDGGGNAFDGSMHSVAFRRRAGTYSVIVDGVVVHQQAADATPPITLNRTAIGALVRNTIGSFINASTQHVCVWDVGLTDEELDAIHAAVPDSLEISTPLHNQILQRNDTGILDINVSGTYVGTPTVIQIQKQGDETWETLDAAPAEGVYSGTYSLPEGFQDWLWVKFANSEGTLTGVYIGVGDIYAIYGQSNASGRGVNLQQYSHPTLFAKRLTSTGWEDVFDPLDSNTKVLDPVATDSVTPGGHWAMQFATDMMADTNVPVGFIIVAKGQTGIADFQRYSSSDDRDTLYGSLVYHCQQQPHGIRGVLFWQGETDALNGMDSLTYSLELATLAGAIVEDLNVRLMPCLLQDCTGIPPSNLLAINDGIALLYGGDNIAEGPDFRAIQTDDDFHFTSDQKVNDAGASWWQAASEAIWVPGGQPLVPPVATFVHSTPTTIRISWTPAEGGIPPYLYRVMRDGILIDSDASSPFDDPSPTPDTLHTYEVYARDIASEYVTSDPVTAALPYSGTGGGTGDTILWNPVLTSGAVLVRCGDTFVYDLETHLDLSSYTELWVTIKNEYGDTDDEAIVQLTLTEGLIRLLGEVPDSLNSETGSVVVTGDESTKARITLSHQATTRLEGTPNAIMDLKGRINGNVYTLSKKDFVFGSSVTRSF